MKRSFFAASSLFLFIILFSSCSLSNNLTEKEDIIRLFADHKNLIVSSIESGAFTEIEKIPVIQDVYQSAEKIILIFPAAVLEQVQIPLISASSILRTRIKRHGTAGYTPTANLSPPARVTNGGKKAVITNICGRNRRVLFPLRSPFLILRP